MADPSGVLNVLLEALHNATHGYTVAADNATGPELVAFFNVAETTRRELADEVAAEVKRLGGEPARFGTAGGVLSRAWMDVKGVLGGRDDLAMLESCEAGEADTERAYEEALAEALPPDTRALLEGHLSAVRDSHARVRELRDRFRAGRS
jgi:uncharacterized protein (TIGR02284 family)